MATQDNEAVAPRISFLRYVPAFLIGLLKDILDIVWFAMMATGALAPVGLVLSFVFGAVCEVIMWVLLYFFVGSKSAFGMRRTIIFLGAAVADFLPGVDILPLATLSIGALYFTDKIHEMANQSVSSSTPRRVGRFVA